MPANDSPVWSILRLAIVGAFLLGFLALNYRNGLVPADLGTIAGVLAALAAFDRAKTVLTEHTKDKP